MLGATACGSSKSNSGGSSGGTSTAAAGGTSTTAAGGGDSAKAKAQAVIDKAKQVPVWKVDAQPFDVTKVKGKTIFNIPVSSTVPYVAAVDKQMQKVATEQGVKWVQFANQGNPTQWAAGINQAISQKADLIILDAGNDPKLVIPALRKAKQAGVPVMVNHLYQNGEGPDPSTASLITAYIAVPFNESGALSVNYAVAKDGCDGVKAPLIITAKEVPPSDGIVNSMQTTLKDLCPDAKAKVVNVPVVDWGTKIAPEAQSAVSSNPDTKWIFPTYDSMSIPAIQGVRQAGKAATVKIASYNGTPDVMKLIQSGDIMQADMGENIEWLAYGNMDQAFRILAGAPIVKGGLENTPLRVFDDSNIAEAAPNDFTGGFGDAFKTGYKKLWGVS
ncbi:sugar ABC transporter substrate-binding protein [Baekduia soli]|uniref:Sugar ABC transporter substrate-binding protein n=1 Tax=Baekduia soli TaxID=496014 RepID=A0A5B8U703_9ACTN|nr:sugar ABC transporter substrate-binding protein [Baekduia soli]QEC48442.1 sugar ABC transporter substrate-binding protein [Baekduia soli]